MKFGQTFHNREDTVVAVLALFLLFIHGFFDLWLSGVEMKVQSDVLSCMILKSLTNPKWNQNI